MEVKIMEPNSRLTDIREKAKEVTDDYGFDGASFPANSFIIPNPQKGVWQILIVSTSDAISKLNQMRTSTKLPQVKIFYFYFFILFFYFYFLFLFFNFFLF